MIFSVVQNKRAAFSKTAEVVYVKKTLPGGFRQRALVDGEAVASPFQAEIQDKNVVVKKKPPRFYFVRPGRYLCEEPIGVS